MFLQYLGYVESNLSFRIFAGFYLTPMGAGVSSHTKTRSAQGDQNLEKIFTTKSSIVSHLTSFHSTFTRGGNKMAAIYLDKPPPSPPPHSLPIPFTLHIFPHLFPLAWAYDSNDVMWFICHQLMGAVISSAGFWIMVEKDKEVRDALDIFFDPSILMCIAGCIIFCLAFFGCLGALRENICLLKTVCLLANYSRWKLICPLVCCQCLRHADENSSHRWTAASACF